MPPALQEAATAGMLALDRVTPKLRSTPGGGSGLAALEERPSVGPSPRSHASISRGWTRPS